MFRKVIISLHIWFLCLTGNYAAEVSWEVGLTKERELIIAEGIINNEGNPTILYLSGLSGNEPNNNLNELVSSYAEVAAPEDINLIVISRANPEGDQLQFPPVGQAYTENTVSHVLWRWIGSHAPDLIIIDPYDDFGFREAITNNGIAGFGPIPVNELSSTNDTVDFLLANAEMQHSPANIQLKHRIARTPLELAEQLASIYGHDFSTPVYVPGMSLIGRLRLGYIDEVEELLAPYHNGGPFEVSNSSALAGQLVFAEHAVLTGNQQSLLLTLQAAELAFDEFGEPLEVAPMHYEMSDSFFMATPLSLIHI